MNRTQVSRRALLRGAGGIAVGLPAMEAMLGGRARGATTRPKRLVIFYSPNGTNKHYPVNYDFVPQQTGPGFVLGKEVTPLEPLRNRLLIISGVNGESCKVDVGKGGDLHSIGMSHMLTGVRFIQDSKFYGMAGSNMFAGYAGGISVDQYLARKIGTATKFASLEFGVISTPDSGPHPFGRMISAGANQPIPPEDDPANMFKRIFGNGTVTAGTTVDRTLAQRKSVLDFVRDDFVRLQPRLSAHDRQKLDAHLTAVRDLETRLARPASPTMVSASCNNGAATLTGAGNALDKANFPATGKLQMDLLVMALRCDVTRIASLQWSWARSTLVHTWVGATQGHHDMSHFGASAPLTAVNNFFAKQLAYLASALAAADEGDGSSVLDNAVIYWCSEVNWAYTHTFDDLRVFLLGNCGGALKVGQHINVNKQPHQKLLVTLMNAMGVAENQFGDSTYGTGPLSGVLA